VDDSIEVLLGARPATLPEVAASLEARTGVTFEQRDSYFWGVYRIAYPSWGRIKIVTQLDPAGDPFEDEHPDYEVLVYIRVCDESSIDLTEILGQEGQLVVLRRSPRGPDHEGLPGPVVSDAG
jgi:hypothetical protein